jgi:plastocyanin
MSGRRTAAVAVLSVTAIALAGCGGGGGSDTTSTAATSTATTSTAAETTTSSTSTSTKLAASVGPGFDISLTLPNGDQITSLRPGTYTIDVDDQSDIHNFHLTGPGGVDETTGVSETGKTTWTVTLVDGKYHYQCDPHASEMSGDFEVSG